MTELAHDPDLPTPAETVTIAFVHSDQVSYTWHHSIIELIGYDLVHHGRVLAGGHISYRYGTGGLVEARNQAVGQFLDEARSDWLFWVDTDMGFPGDTVDRLIEAADPVTRPIVGALCFSQRETDPDGLGGWRTRPTPTIFSWAKVDVVRQKVINGSVRREVVGEQQGFAVRWDYPQNAVVQCSGTGSACVLVHRGVYERIRAEFGPGWYDRVPNPSTGQIVSEDLSFCIRAGALDIPVHVHTGVRTTHHKPIWLAEEDFWRRQAVEPAAPEAESVLAGAEAAGDG